MGSGLLSLGSGLSRPERGLMGAQEIPPVIDTTSAARVRSCSTGRGADSQPNGPAAPAVEDIVGPVSGSEGFLERLSAVARSLQNEAGTGRTLDTAAAAATALISACDLADVSTIDEKGVHTHAATGDAVLAVHALQYELSEGPAVDALRDHETVHSPDLTADQRWPTWGPRVARELGMRSVLSFRLFTTGETFGALNLFSRTVNAFDEDDIDNTLALAAHVALAMAAELNDEQLHIALAGRTVIGQAQGILMERYDLTADRAFEVLVRYSTSSNIKLRQVASELVATRTTPGR